MTIYIGKLIIKQLATHGSWVSESGESVIATDELFGRDPYAEIERLRTVLQSIASLEVTKGAAANAAEAALQPQT